MTVLWLTESALAYFKHAIVFLIIEASVFMICWIIALKPEQNGCHFANDIFTFIPLNNVGWKPILNKVSRFYPKNPLDTNWTLVQVMARRWIGNMPLSGPIVAYFTGAYMRYVALMIYKADWVSTSFSNWGSSWIGIYTIIVNSLPPFYLILLLVMFIHYTSEPLYYTCQH